MFGTAERTSERVLNGFASQLIDETQHRSDRLSAGLGERPGSEAFGNRIDVLDASLGIRADHRIADRLQRYLRPLLLGKDRLLGALALGDVGDRALITD